MTVILQDDHLTAGAWAPCGLRAILLQDLGTGANRANRSHKSVDYLRRQKGDIRRLSAKR